MPLDPAIIAQFDDYLEAQKQSRLAESVAYAKQGDPSAFRRADLASTQTGIPFSVAAQDVERAEAAAAPGEDIDLRQLQRDNPVTAEWFSDPRKAAISFDDMKLMKLMEDNDNINTPLNLAKYAGTAFSRVAGDLLEIAGGRMVAAENFLNQTGVPTLKVNAKDGVLKWSTDSEDSVYQFIENVGKWASTGADNFYGAEAEFTTERMMEDPSPANVLGFIAETFAGSVAEMALSAVPVIGAPLLAAATTQRLAEQRVLNEGGGEVEFMDLLKTAPAGLLTAYMERFATKGLLGKLADQTEIEKLTAGLVGKEVGKSTLREAGTELIQEEVEYVAETLGTPVDMTAEEATKRAIGAVVAGGGLGAGGRAATLPLHAIQTRVERDTTRAVESAMDQAGIDELITNIKQSKLFQESPERASEFLRGLEGNNNLFISQEAILAAADEGFTVPGYLLDQARSKALNDVSSTVDAFAMDVMTDEKLLDRLRPHIKRKPDGLTLDEIQNRDLSSLDKLLTKAVNAKEIKEETDALEKEMVDQIVATGRMDRTRARQSAAPLVAYIATKTAELRARGVSITPGEIYKKMNFTIKKAETPEKGKKAAKKAPPTARNPEEILDQNVNKAPLIQPNMETGVTVAEDGQTIQEHENPRVRMHFTEVTKRIPELTQAAQKVKDGTMPAAEYARMVNKFKPVTPYSEPPVPNTMEEVTNALSADKRDKVGTPRNLKAGQNVGIRLDIPAYSNSGVWAVSVHEAAAGFKAGKVIGYDNFALVNNVTLGAHEAASINIARGRPKATIAVVKGAWQPATEAEATALADQAMTDPDWIQVGYDPERHSYFYDRKTMAPVVGGEQALQIGPLVMVKNPTYGDPDSFLYQEETVDMAAMEGELSALEQLLACTRAA